MNTPEEICIFLVDDHPLIRTGLKHGLVQKEGFVLAGEASDGYGAVEKIGEALPDIGLIDMDMPGLSGVAVVRMLKKSHPEIKLLILSTFSEEKFVKDAMAAGADGYLLKNVPLDEMEKIIRAVCAGDACFSPYLLNLAVAEPAAVKSSADTFHLTNRELEVLSYIAQGTPNKEISTILFISLETIKSHVKNIYRKLGAKNRVEAVRMATEKGLID